RHHVENHDLLEFQRIENVDQKVENQNEAELRADQVAPEQAGCGKQNRARERRTDPELARRERALRFYRVEFVVLQVGNIVEEVDAAAHQREKKEPLDNQHDIVRKEQVARKDEGGKEKEILNPLLQPHRGDERADHH